MLVSFTAQEKRHVISVFEDLLEHEKLEPNRTIRKLSEKLRNRFIGPEEFVRLKPKELKGIWDLVDHTLKSLEMLAKSDKLPEENRSDAVEYVNIVRNLSNKLKEINEKRL
jgi:hypothetical protein